MFRFFVFSAKISLYFLLSLSLNFALKILRNSVSLRKIFTK